MPLYTPIIESRSMLYKMGNRGRNHELVYKKIRTLINKILPIGLDHPFNKYEFDGEYMI